MIYGIYNSAAGMLTGQYKQDVIANNLANADTVGFKRDLATFAERIPAEHAGVRQGPSDRGVEGLSGGMWLGRTHTLHTDGTLERTGRAEDVALDGPGFFVVEKDGQQLLSRDGRFVTDADGVLRAASDGALVLDRAGQAMRISRQGGDLSINADGEVFQDDRRIGQLALTDVRDYDALTKTGASRFIADEENLTGTPARVLSGVLERSTVEPVKELASMLLTSRRFQLNARMIQLQDESVGRMISVIR